MQISIDEEGTLLIRFKDGVKTACTKEPFPELFVDLDAAGEVISIEVVAAGAVSASELAKVFKQFGLDQKLIIAA